MEAAPVRRRRRVVAGAAAVVVLGTLAWLWSGTLLPSAFSVTLRGPADLGGGPSPSTGHWHAHGQPGRPATAGTVDVRALAVDAGRAADVSHTLVARQERFRLASGREVDGYTVNGTSPGPTIEARRGDLVEVRLVNESVAGGATLHWHGLDLPNAADGVAGVTQDAVAVGEEFVYRFVAEQVGTFWYHSHQISHEQVRRGLLGALVIREADGAGPGAAVAGAETPAADLTALVHVYGGARTVNGLEEDLRVTVRPGETARVRVINSENGAMPVWVSGARARLLAVDGADLHEPGPLGDVFVRLTAGGRADLEVTSPADGSGARVELGGSRAVVLAPPGAEPPPTRAPGRELDLLSYGAPSDAGPAARTPTRTFDYAIGRRPGVVGGRPGLWWTVNGRLYPDVPTFVVTEGDVVHMRITNRSGEAHPMHLHGHHVLVLSRDGVPATGSPWWTDSLHVADGETYEVAFVADNPGIWMDHCHNLPHAREGLVAHLAYAGVTTPFLVGGHAHNAPE